MANPIGGEDLRPYVRDERPRSGDVVVVRGGPDTLVKLAEHARRTHRAFSLDGEPLWGVSVFCALDEIGPASLNGLLADRMVTYRVVHTPTVGRLSEAGFELLPTFRRPHYTVRLANGDEDGLTRLLEALGPAKTNPYHGVGLDTGGGDGPWSASISPPTSTTRTRPVTCGRFSMKRGTRL